jgi:lipoyl(octanoyl) transferase
MQEELFRERVAAKIKPDTNELPDVLIFCEHPHVFTLGKSGDQANLLAATAELQKKEAEFFRTNRGGDITYHGPGQIVAYPIIDLEKRNIGVRQYVYLLEESVIRFLDEYGIIGERLSGATGVWLDTGTSRARKICAIGIRSSRHITMHGLALNINTDLSYFGLINPCGFTDKGVSSLQKENGEIQDMDKAREVLKHQLSEKLGLRYL